MIMLNVWAIREGRKKAEKLRMAGAILWPVAAGCLLNYLIVCQIDSAIALGDAHSFLWMFFNWINLKSLAMEFCTIALFAVVILFPVSLFVNWFTVKFWKS